jgi:hypothetical protein
MTGRSVAPLKVDAETDALITQGAHFLGVTKKDLVAEAVRVYLAMQRTALQTIRKVVVMVNSLEKTILCRACGALLEGCSVPHDPTGFTASYSCVTP